MKLDFNFNLKNIDGTDLKAPDKPEESVNAGKVLAVNLYNYNKGDALKFNHWAKKIYAGEAIDLDPSDLETLRKFIDTPERLANGLKAQLLEICITK